MSWKSGNDSEEILRGKITTWLFLFRPLTLNGKCHLQSPWGPLDLNLCIDMLKTLKTKEAVRKTLGTFHVILQYPPLPSCWLSLKSLFHQHFLVEQTLGNDYAPGQDYTRLPSFSFFVLQHQVLRRWISAEFSPAGENNTEIGRSLVAGS